MATKTPKASTAALFLNSILSLDTTALQKRGFRLITQKGFSHAWLIDPELQRVWKTISRYYKSYGDLPDADKMKQAHPSFPLNVQKGSPGRLEAVLDDLRVAYMEHQTRSVLEEAHRMVDSDPLSAAQWAREQLIKMTSLNTPLDATDLSEASDQLKEMYSQGGQERSAITWPWPGLQEETGGIHPAEFIVFSGRPKNLKTFLMMYVAVHAYIECGARVALISRELPSKLALRRIAAMVARVDYSAWKKGTLTYEEEKRTFDFIDGLRKMESSRRSPIRTDLAPGFRIVAGHSQIYNSMEMVEAVIEDFQPDIIADDGFYLAVSNMGVKGAPMDWKLITHLTQWAKRTASTHNLAYIATTQANRASERASKSSVSVFSYSDSFAQDADLAMRVIKKPEKNGVPQHCVLLMPAFREGTLEHIFVNAQPCVNFTEISREQAAAYGLQSGVEGSDDPDDEEIDRPAAEKGRSEEAPDIPDIPSLPRKKRKA